MNIEWLERNVSWLPDIYFGVRDGKLLIYIKFGDYPTCLRHDNWIISDNMGDLDLSQIEFARIRPGLSEFLYLDMKARPRVHEFLASGPPGDGNSLNTVVDLIKLILIRVEEKYTEYKVKMNNNIQ